MNQINECAELECGNPGTPRGFGSLNLSLCDEHTWDLAAHRRSLARDLIAEMKEEGLITGHTAGWTYVIRLANGNVKIGMTKGNDMKRLKDLPSKVNQGIPTQVLALIKGGLSREMLAHSQWFSLRVPGHMEEFYPDPSLVRWAEEQGIHPEARMDLLDSWMENKHNRGSKGTAAQAMWNYATESDETWQ